MLRVRKRKRLSNMPGVRLERMNRKKFLDRNGHRAIKFKALGNISYFFAYALNCGRRYAENRNSSLIRHKPENRFQERCFTGAVRPDNRRNFSLVHVESNIIQYMMVVKRYVQIFYR